MLSVISPDEMKKLDQLAINQGKIPGLLLMENAAMAVTSLVQSLLSEELQLSSDQSRVCIFSGIGNNGGDGLAAARQLVVQGYQVELVLVGDTEKLSGDALINWEIVRHRDDIMIHTIKRGDSKELSLIEEILRTSDIIMDALLGTGLSGAPREPINTCIKLINQSKNELSRVVSVDIPSGVFGDTGQVVGNAVVADHTITFAWPKIGLLLYPGANYIGTLVSAPIGIPHWLTSEIKSNNYLVTDRRVAELLPERSICSHKGDFGRVTVVAGSRKMLGAGILTANSAMKTGSGLVTLAVPDSEEQTAQSKLKPEIMSWGLDSKNGVFAPTAGKELMDENHNNLDVMAIGPGISVNEGTEDVVESVVTNVNCPLVIDADALNILSNKKELLENHGQLRILTPHIGEFSRLTGYSIEKVQEISLELVKEFALKWNSIIVLKGAPTIIGTPDQFAYIVFTGNSGMASGGMGDVLTGIITSLIGQGLTIEEAAIVGVYLHKTVGEKARDDLGEMVMTAEDIWRYLPKAIEYIS